MISKEQHFIFTLLHEIENKGVKKKKKKNQS